MKTLKFKLIAAAIASLIITANSASAQAIRASYTVTADEPLTVKYLGTDGEYLTFEVIVKFNDSRGASLGVSDKSIGEIYGYNFRPGASVQKLKIEKKDNQELNFKLDTGKSVYIKSFSVNTQRIENTVVSENNITKL